MSEPCRCGATSPSRAKFLVELLDRYQPRTIIEIGSVRNANESHHYTDGHSTLYVADWLRRNPLAHFLTVDRENAQYALDALDHAGYTDLNSRITCAEGEGIDFLACVQAVPPWGCVYLDASDNPEENLSLFRVACMTLDDHGVIVMDDTDIWEQMKGLAVVPLLRLHKIPHEYKVGGKFLVVDSESARLFLAATGGAR